MAVIELVDKRSGDIFEIERDGAEATFGMYADGEGWVSRRLTQEQITQLANFLLNSELDDPR